MSQSLFGDEFEIQIPQVDTKKLIKKIEDAGKSEINVEKALKSKKVSLQERLALINENVLRILGKQKQNVLVIKDKETFNDYVAQAINSERIAIDTETNNSLDAITCKLMGLCLYYAGGKQAYIPLNHRDPTTQERLPWQLTEEDCKEQLQKIKEANTFCVFHNYKFDYKVIKCTCDIEVPCHWDTLIASKLIDENEISAGLKQQYISKIDPSQEKYSIDHLFENVEYADVDPEIFALYAATDSMMTDKLYLWQKPIMEGYKNEPGPFGKTVYDLYTEVELPCVRATAEMELNGIRFDNEYAKRLKIKFEQKLTEIDTEIAKELQLLEEKINLWKLSPEANFHPAKKSGEGVGKSKLEQLEDPIALSSPTQLAILLYDILKVPVVDKEAPRGTGEEVLEKLNLPLTKLLLERRGVVKLLDAFINSLPEKVNPKTGKIHCSFNQYGAKTGRFSSSEPNLQQIPSHEKSIRLLFTADCENHIVECTDNYYEVPITDEVETTQGWKKVKELVIGDVIIGQDNQDTLKEIKIIGTNYLLYT